MDKFIADNPAWLLGIFAACAVTAFQLGYFFDVGLPFLTFMGLQDWLFFTASILPVVVLVLPLVYLLTPEDALHRRPFTWLVATAVIFVPTYLWFGFLGSVSLGFLLAIVSAVSVIKSGRQPLLSDPAPALFGFAGLMLTFGWLGLLFAWALQWQPCKITTDKGGMRDVFYIRALAEGHLTKEGGATVFTPKSEVKEIRCIWNGPLATGRIKFFGR